MHKKTALLVLVTLITVTILLYMTQILDLFDYSIAAMSKYGSSGAEVTKIQTKLSDWGYYTGNIDGLYGYMTYSAVKSFQSKNGLDADGIAGPQTLTALGISSGNASGNTQNTGGQAAGGTDSGDVQLLAHLIYGEARGEPYEGKVAVGAVVLNRTTDSRFPKTLAGVIYQPGAFDAVSDGQIDLAPDSGALNAARDAINGWDPSYGCVYYYNPNTATSSWIWSRPIIVVIGNHNFAK
jgi:N-acetylmuramoyl-L-alanine amidase